MSRRTLNQSQGMKNPAVRFLEWKSDEKCLSYYDKEAKKDVLVDLPVKFQFLEEFSTVKGWNDANNSNIFSNEVKFVSKEPVKVQTYKGNKKLIAEGLYKDIKSQVKDAGGHYCKSVYALNEDGEIVNISFKGAVVKQWGEFMESDGNKIESFWLVFADHLDMKKGKVKYSVPVLEIGEAFDEDLNILADEAYEKISEYYNRYSSKKEEDLEPVTAGDDENDDEIDF